MLIKKKRFCASVSRAGWKPGAEKTVLKFVVWFDLISEMLGRLLVCVTASVLTGQKPLYPELNGKCEHCCRKHIFLHFPLICLPCQEALTWVVHQFKRVDFFFTLFLSLLSPRPPSSFLPEQTAIVTYWVSQKWKIFMQACNTCNEVSAWPSAWLIL